MNFAQRWLRRLGQAFAVLRDPDAGLLRPLPEPLVNPRLSAGQLTDQAREQGRADGRQDLYDGWSFGSRDDPPGTVREPAYIEGLRERCESAVHEHHDRQVLTEARMADLHLIAQEARQQMDGARQRMAQIAVRDQFRADGSLRSFLHRHDITIDDQPMPQLNRPVWEGEVVPLRPIWRTLIVLFLIAVVFVIEHYAARTYLPTAGLGQVSDWVLTGAVAGLTVIGPLLSGQLFRNRHATGFDGLLTGLTFVLLLPTLAIVLCFGLLAATLAGRPVAPSRAPSTTLTPATLVLVFDVVLFLACTMAYLIGLAQRHPFQQSFVRNRQTRERTVQLIQRMGTRINEDYRASPEMSEAEQAAPYREAAIRHAYGAAEDAYYQGLIEAVADPTFTDAVQRRRTSPTESDHD